MFIDLINGDKKMYFMPYYVIKLNACDAQSFSDVKELNQVNFFCRRLLQVPYPASNLYEAMYMYALSVNMTSSEGNDSSNGRLIATRLWGNSFTSKIYTYNLLFLTYYYCNP